ncbi:uncharacterized protein [Asterias amurensis]|uniref:uncharacterized protein n=1 Tax=Asterias amurensis TaxID=7602 RepID=UPI003AB2AB6A
MCEHKQRLIQLTKEVHAGGKKNDLLTALAWDASYGKSNEEWDGHLVKDDFITVLKTTKSGTEDADSFFDEIVRQEIQSRFQIQTEEMLFVEDTKNVSEVIDWFQRRIPGVVPSLRKIRSLKKKCEDEFKAVWKPNVWVWRGNVNCMERHQTRTYTQPPSPLSRGGHHTPTLHTAAPLSGERTPHTYITHVQSPPFRESGHHTRTRGYTQSLPFRESGHHTLVRFNNVCV